MSEKSKKKNARILDRQMDVWADIHHADDGTMTWGIECDNKSLTFDGHFMCLFPAAPEDTEMEGARKRAEEVIKYMRGEKQVRRF